MSDMNDVPRQDGGRDGEGVDPRLREILAVLDPGRLDPAYWERFHRSVVLSVAGELGRRRALADLSVSELVTSWARTVVPTALLAAAAASLMLFEPASLEPPVLVPGAEGVIGVEEALVEGLEGDRIPAMLSDDALPAGGVTFAAEIF